MVKKSQVALHVRVVLNDVFGTRSNSLAKENLKSEPELYIGEPHVYNDDRGDYVLVCSEHLPEVTSKTTGLN